LILGSTLLRLNNCIFIGNSAGGGSGGLSGAYDSPPKNVATNCTFIGNIAAGFGGGASGVILINSSLTGNRAGSGGGLYNGYVNGCVVANNVATTNGGGMYSRVAVFDSTCSNSIFSNNVAVAGGGAYISSGQELTFTNCIFWGNSASGNGGAMWYGRARNCLMISNSAVLGGGAYYPHCDNCSIVGNSASQYGGGTYNGTLNNCTLTANSAAQSGGGVYRTLLYNCIVYFNTAPSGSNYTGPIIDFYNCCTTPMPLAQFGTGNLTNAPLFVDLAGGNFRLQSNSLCINAGNNAYVSIDMTNDLDGNPRIVGGTVDIGAYEYQTPVSMIAYPWLQQYGLPLSTNTDTADADGDGMNNYQEWRTGTNPTNPASVLKITQVDPNPAGLVVTWQSVSGINYFLQSSTNLAAQLAFTTIQINIFGQTGTKSYTDTTATNGGPYFYRVGVQ
jgi:hypothetical protein